MVTIGSTFLQRFSEHEVVSSTEGRWLLQSSEGYPDNWMEVVALAGGKLLVHGDYDPVCFAYHDGVPEARVHWMARNYKDEPCSYVMEKAQIGTGGRRVVKCFDTDKAQTDIAKHAVIMREEGYERLADKYTLLAGITWKSEHDMYEYISDFDVDYLDYEFGLRPTYAVYAAWATLIRLSKILKEEKRNVS